MFIAVLLLFAPLLLAPTPAPAQTTITLLDIRSPATADPPSTSLLTVSDAGDLWIKGQLIEYSYPGLITLDPAKQYWAIRNADGDVLWALEAYDPATGISTGDLHAACTFESNCFQVEQAGALFTARTASGEAVFSMSADGVTKAKGENLTQTTARGSKPKPPWPDMPPQNPPPAFLPQTPPDSFSLGVTSKPEARGRFYYLPFIGSVSGPDSDVTGIAWRQRWVPSYDSLLDYGVCPGFRCQSIWQWPADWEYYPIHFGLPILEGDWEVAQTEGGQRYWKHYSFWIPDILDDNWNIDVGTDLAAGQPLAPLDLSASMTNNPDPVYGTAIQDPPTSASSRLFLYSGKFKHPDPGSIPRKAGNRSVNVFFQLLPEEMPTTWTNRIELTIWDPAYVGPYGEKYHRRVFKSTESECTSPSLVGKPFVSKMWDGKLWTTEDGKPDPQYPNDFYYTQASDIFMEATVYWNVSDPQKPWESTEPDVFTESSYAIIVEAYGWDPVSADPNNFAWINAGDATTSPSMPALSAYLDTNGDYVLPTTGNWKLTITFPRAERGVGSKDTTDYPTTGTTAIAGDQSWSPSFGTDTRGVRGGEAVFTCALATQTLTHKVHIRGLNPIPDSVATGYIGTHCGAHWYATLIAKYETRLWMEVEDPAAPEYSGELSRFGEWVYHGALYNQFYPRVYDNRLPSLNPHEPDRVQGVTYNEQRICPGNPRHHHDTGGTVGYGMMQITDSPATAQQVWDWQANVKEGISRLNGFRTSALTYCQQTITTPNSSVEPTSMTIAGVYLTNQGNDHRCWELEAIYNYNAGGSNHFFVADSPLPLGDSDNYWDVAVHLHYEGTEVRWRDEPSTAVLQNCNYVERVLGMSE